MSFKKYVLDEGREGIKATHLERYIPIIWNDATNHNFDLDHELELASTPKIKLTAEEYDSIPDEVKDDIIEKLATRIKGGSQSLVFVSSGDANVRESDDWQRYKELYVGEEGKAKSRGTAPKSDFVTKDGNVKIAFKKLGGSVMLYSGPEESSSTFLAAHDLLVENKSEYEKIINQAHLKDTMEKMASKLSKTLKRAKYNYNVSDTAEKMQTLPKEIEAETNTENRALLQKEFEKVSSDYEKQQTLRNEGHELADEIISVFAESPILKKYVVYEALTGTIKFKDTPIGIANTIMAAQPNKVNAVVAPLTYDFCDNIAKKVNIRIDFKTSGTNVSSALKIPSTSTVPDTEISDIRDASAEGQNESFSDFQRKYEDLLEEAYINEGVMDLVSKAIEWVKELWEKIKAILDKGIDNFMEFFGLSFETVNIEPQAFKLTPDMFK